MTTNPQDVQVRTPADLATVWQLVMGRRGPGLRSLWLVFLNDAGWVQPVVVPVDNVPTEPDPNLAAGLAGVLAELRDVGDPALLLSRPGPRHMTDADRRWARALTPLTPWPVHLYTAAGVRVFAPDDLVESADR